MIRSKQYILKIIAISISLLYVLHPLQHQIKDGLHAISHAIDSHTVAVHTHSHTSTAGHNHSHTHAQDHEHQIITFINNLFSEAENNSNDGLVQQVKIDKHIVDTTTYTIKNYSILPTNYIYTSPYKTAKGYILAAKKPPKSPLA
ncbi:hypothetical protein KLA_09949 [Cellulophaga geojensis KL-A]|uniref:Uncharacterized protein n=1 Tax=Cellulophaga geojensis KL-A TaxID=1328323 RepID=A0ABN0RNP9_9FLAO|nr:hypothetical protein [Cellulophaga geojensis]EWH13444.1 hypothetical protein KLA_09949 [Cellulophaga geojensis KL-A]